MLSPRQFYFVRHEQSDWNLEGLIIGGQDRPLTPYGHDQARMTAIKLASLPVAQIFCSPLQRARVTAEIIALALDQHTFATPGLAEVNLGEWEGREEVALRHELGSWVDGSQPPGGEAFSSFSRRIADATNDCLTSHSPGQPLLVAHAGVFWALMRLVGREVFDPEHCQPYLFTPEGNRWVVRKVG